MDTVALCSRYQSYTDLFWTHRKQSLLSFNFNLIFTDAPTNMNSVETVTANGLQCGQFMNY